MFWSHDFLTEFLKILVSISINTAFLISPPPFFSLAGFTLQGARWCKNVHPFLQLQTLFNTI